MISGANRGLRGSGWDVSGAFLRSSDRYGFPPDLELPNSGFRVASP